MAEQDKSFAVCGVKGYLTAGELMAALTRVPAEARVVFDTEARDFNAHLVSVSSLEFDEEINATLGEPAVVLHYA